MIFDLFFAENETQANQRVANCLLLMLLLYTCGFILSFFPAFTGLYMAHESMTIMFLVCLLLVPLPAILCKCGYADRKWMKYVAMTIFIVTLSLVSLTNSVTMQIIWLFPFILCAQYFDTKMILFTLIQCILFLNLSLIVGIFYKDGSTSIGYALSLISGSSITIDGMLSKTYSFIAGRTLVLVFAAILSLSLTNRSRALLENHAESLEKNNRIETELDVATKIQASMLPLSFATSQNHNEFCTWASMEPAKEVGGDFYDIYQVNDHTLALVIADASGKGIPAAIYAVMAQALMKSHADSGVRMDELFDRVNKSLVNKNNPPMFITAWMGLLDLRTGHLEFANAGHNAPLLRRKNGEFAYIKQKKNLVLGISNRAKYALQTIDLDPGDELFLYTDGVNEAMNAQAELFGYERLLNVLNTKPQESCEYKCDSVRAAIAEFVGEAEQSDDMTMLSLRYEKMMTEGMVSSDEMYVPAIIESMPVATKFVQDQLTRYHAGKKTLRNMSVVLDELLGNIIKHAYPDGKGNVGIHSSIEVVSDEIAESGNKTMRIIVELSDTGVAFNPLEADEAHLDADAQKRQFGGYGIHISRRLLDSLSYARIGERNVLTLSLSFVPEEE